MKITIPTQKRDPGPTRANFGADGKARGALKNSWPPGLAKSKEAPRKGRFQGQEIRACRGPKDGERKAASWRINQRPHIETQAV